MSAFDVTPLRPDAPAMPMHGHMNTVNDWTTVIHHSPGFTAQQHAAIALRVPNSGTDWLDDMIRVSLRDEFAAKAMAAVIGAIMPIECHRWTSACFAKEGYEIADAMMTAREPK